jgi:ferredoxin--NADP+ reductase/benzoate/toluate 1,2-dioxygenase reductase subunit
MASRDLLHTVLGRRDLTGSTFVLRFERRNLAFEPGQHLVIGPEGARDLREYSVYSGTADPWLEVLVKTIEGGEVSPLLARLRAGDRVRVEGPFGEFTLDRKKRAAPLVLVATGTGISPFHSMVRSYPGLRYTLVHGVRRLEERYEHGDYPEGRLVSCVSGEAGGDVEGRVTAWLDGARLETGASYHLCGNCDMIYSMYDRLTRRGVGAARIAAEVYF